MGRQGRGEDEEGGVGRPEPRAVDDRGPAAGAQAADEGGGRELVGAVRTVIAGHAYLSPEIAGVVVGDYVSGMAKAWSTGKLCSKTGLRGILKKLGYLALVGVAGVVDWLVRYGLTQVGVEVSFRTEFEFKSRILQKAAGVFFHQAMQQVVRAFEKRAQQLYGARSTA